MSYFVLDASVALGWALDKPSAPYAGQVRQRMQDGARAIVPALWHLEVANTLAIAARRGILTATDMDRSLNDMEKLLSRSIETDNALISARDASATALALGLTAYDGVYLDLARRHGWPLATLDEKLKAAARRTGVALLH